MPDKERDAKALKKGLKKNQKQKFSAFISYKTSKSRMLMYANSLKRRHTGSKVG